VISHARKLAALLGLVVAPLAVALPAARADPSNARTLPISWSCADGHGGTFQYTGVGIANSHAYTGHVVDPASNATFIVAQTLQYGEVTPMRKGLVDGIPGLLGRPDLITCDLIAIGGEDATFLGIQAIGFLTKPL